MADLVSAGIPAEDGKRHPFSSVAVGYCADMPKQGADVAGAIKPGALCAQFTLANPVMGMEGLTDRLIMASDVLAKSTKTLGTQVSGYTQAMDMMQKFGK